MSHLYAKIVSSIAFNKQRAIRP